MPDATQLRACAIVNFAAGQNFVCNVRDQTIEFGGNFLDQTPQHRRSFAFGELEALSNSFANGLVAAGVQPGDRVTLYGPNSWQWMVAYYAIAKTGAVVNPVNALLTPEEVNYIIKDSGARIEN